MNNKRLLILIIIIVLSLLSLLMYRYLSERLPKYKWDETYSHTSDEPYGTKVLFQLLKNSVDKGEMEVVKKSLSKHLPLKGKNNNYVFIGNFFPSDSIEIAHLLNFVKNGNKAFLFSPDISLQFFNDITKYEMRYNYYDTTQISVYFPYIDTLAYRFNYRFLKSDINYRWSCLEYDFFTDSLEEENFNDISYIENHICYFSVKYGEGELFFHTIPMLFTNYHLINNYGFENAKKCFFYLNNGTIYWDEKNQFLSNPHFNNPDESPLRYILQQNSFRWAWYVGIALILIYIIFRSRREQRIIPIINKPINTSVDFNKAISTLYYQSNDNSIIAEEIMKMFMIFLKNKYGITINLNNYNEYTSLLSVRSGINENTIIDIFNNYISAFYGDKKDGDLLVKLHQSIEYFYKNCK